MSTQRRSQSERRESTRRRLVDAAAVVFAAQGYRDATVADVVAEAGVSTGALYNHFPGKRELFLAVFDEGFDDWSSSYTTAMAGTDDIDNALRQAAQNYDDLLRQRPAGAQLLIEFWSAAMRDESLRPAFIERHAQIQEAMGALIAAMQDRLGIDLVVPPQRLGSIVTALADGLAMQKLIQPGSDKQRDSDLLLTALRLLLAGASALSITDARPAAP